MTAGKPENFKEIDGTKWISNAYATELLGRSRWFMSARTKGKPVNRIHIGKYVYYPFQEYQEFVKRQSEPKARSQRPAKLEKVIPAPKGYCGKCKSVKAQVDYEDFDGYVKKLCWDCWWKA